jgi:hypothetical protein
LDSLFGISGKYELVTQLLSTRAAANTFVKPSNHQTIALLVTREVWWSRITRVCYESSLDLTHGIWRTAEEGAGLFSLERRRCL